MRAIALAIIILAVSIRATVLRAVSMSNDTDIKWGTAENALSIAILISFLVCLVMGW